VQTFYELLSVAPSATAEEIKRAFRNEIARYHPDKVQHLGKEFQAMAATRAASLTEAYRTLMNAELRAEYDRLHVVSAGPEGTAPSAAAPSHSPRSSGYSSAAPSSHTDPSPSFATSSSGHASASPRPEAPPSAEAEAASSSRFAAERRDRDSFVRHATVGKFRQAVAAEMGQVDESPAKSFDFDCATKAKGLFSRNGAQRLAVRFVPHVDRAAVQEAWMAASQKRGVPVCVFLMGNSVAPAAELGEAIAGMRKKSREPAAITIIPVDVRDWSAHVPADAPAACKKVLQRLRESK
jgi:curved DNA-binding protein CbpA